MAILNSDAINETRIANGLASASAYIEIYLNAQTSTWTMISVKTNRTTCIVASGEDFNFDIDGLTKGAVVTAWR